MYEPIKSRPWAILLAAGKGTRISSSANDIPKQFILYKNKPLYWHSALKMSFSAVIGGIIFVFPQAFFETESARLNKLCINNSFSIPWKAVIGGETRNDSVAAGLAHIPVSVSHILIHDAARPFFKTSLLKEICRKLDDGFKAVIPGIPVVDTIKLCKINEPDKVEKTLPRDRLLAIQTPQAFDAIEIRNAHQAATTNLSNVTDDACLIEKAGHEVCIVPGDPENIKITYPADLSLLTSRNNNLIPCSGFGYDAHRFGPGRVLKLGGIEIPGDLQIIAHSDGDVLLHALMDAILGCACLGDIGQFFPDHDPKYEGISSSILLQHILLEVDRLGVKIYHVDLTLVAQKPRIANFRQAIQKNLARLLDLSLEMVNFKATTEEKMGFTGSMEGIKAYAIVNAWRNV